MTRTFTFQKEIIAAHMDASFGHLISLTEYFQQLNFDENVIHGHKNTNFSTTNKGIFTKIHTCAHKMYIYFHVYFRDDP